MNSRVLFVMLCFACGPEGESATRATETETENEVENAQALPMENGGEPDPPVRPEEEGSADEVPERGQLEARCFSGDQAACDELGH